MANPKHLQTLRKGVEAWNNWRLLNDKVQPDLRGLNLAKINLEGANLTDTKLGKTILRGANLNRVNFSRAELIGTDFSDATIQFSRFVRTVIQNVSFKNAELSHSFFFRGCWNGIKLTGACLYGTTFHDCEMTKVDFGRAELLSTIFSNVDFKGAIGLDKANHEGPLTIGTDTLYRTGGKIPDNFLRDAGVPEGLISFLPALIGAAEPIQRQSCFISYSTKNQKFAKRLHARMRQEGLRVWFASEDMKGGRHTNEQIDQAIQIQDRLLLVLSEDSIQSKWVEREIRKARKIERAEKRRKLFPITLTDFATLKGWECLDSDTGEDLAVEVRKYHIPDFSNWKNHAAFEHAFARLEKDLRTSIGR